VAYDSTLNQVILAKKTEGNTRYLRLLNRDILLWC